MATGRQRRVRLTGGALVASLLVAASLAGGPIRAGAGTTPVSAAQLSRPGAVANIRSGLTPPPLVRRGGLSSRVASPVAPNAAVSALPHGLTGPGGTWINLGPKPIPNGQTSPASVPVSGRVSAIAIDPRDPNVVYIGGAQGGVWRSKDGGVTWTPLMDTAASLAIGALALAPSSPSTLYVGTGEANFSGDSFAGVGLYRIDNADTTATVVGPIDPPFVAFGTDSFGGLSISKILVKPDDPATIFVSTVFGFAGIDGNFPRGAAIPPLPPPGLWRSTNATAAAGSVTFARVVIAGAPGTVAQVTDMVFDPADATSNTLLLGTADINFSNGAIYRTTNALAATPAFTLIQTLTLPSFRIVLAAALTPGPNPTSVIYAGTDETQTLGVFNVTGVLRRAPNGGSVANSFVIVPAANGFCAPQCFYDIVVTVPPTDPTTIYLGGSVNGSPNPAETRATIEKSTNTGASFTTLDATVHADDHAITLAPSNSSIVYTGSDGGVWKSLNGATAWASENTLGLSITQYQSIAVHPSDPNFSIGGTQDNGTVFLQPNGTYTRADFGDGGYSEIDQNAADNVTVTMYHTYFNATNSLIGFARVDSVANAMDGMWAFKGCNGGVSANGITCGDAVNFYAPVELGPGNPNTVYFGTDRLYRSTNKGDINTVVSQAPLVSGVPISDIGISPQNDNVRIVGLNNGQVFATTTGSSTLTNVTPTAAGYVPQYVTRAVIDPTNQNTAYITLSGYMGSSTAHVWKTTNLAGGPATWVQAGSGIPDVPVDSFVVNLQTPSTLYAGTDIGVYRSLDGGATWLPYGAGLPTVAVFDMALTAPGSTQVLRISTHGRGQWQINLNGPGNAVPEVPWLPLLVAAGATALLPVRRILRRPG